MLDRVGPYKINAGGRETEGKRDFFARFLLETYACTDAETI